MITTIIAVAVLTIIILALIGITLKDWFDETDDFINK